MGTWTREELEREFVAYQERGAAGDWSAWADQFTEDAQYVEHNYGVFDGREAIREWIVETMGTWPGNEMPVFPIEWYIVDDERGWIVAKIWNRMQEEAKSLSTHSRRIIAKGSDHDIQIDRPDLLNKEVPGFIADIRNRDLSHLDGTTTAK